jgi:hypothetical protein
MASGQNARSRPGLDPAVVVGLAGEVLLAAVNVVGGVRADPGMLERGVVGDEVEHEPHPARGEALAEARERRRPAEVPVHDVVAHGEGRATDVVRRRVGQELAVEVPPLGEPGDPASGLARLPDPEEPDPVEARGRDTPGARRA